MRTPTLLVIAAVAVASLASCGKTQEARQKTAGDLQVQVLATVNGVPITSHDLDLRLEKIAAGGSVHDVSNNILNTIVRDELIYQEAVRLGLDKDPEYRLKLGAFEAQLRAFQRQELAGLFRSHVREQAAITEAEAREYFEKNAKEIQGRFHVLQILYKGKSTEIAQAHEDLKRGVPFETVAARRFPVVPRNARAPWDLGELRWQQLPQAWRGIVDRLEPGQISDIIKGEGERYWVIKLVSKTVDPQVTFATERERIAEALTQQKADELYGRALAELKAKADVVYSR